MIEIFFTVWLGTGIFGDRTIVQSISQKVLVDYSKYNTCKQLIINQSDITKEELEKKAIMYICDFPKPKND
tara:strand:- start:291 stop:503 length:213 start_codon:yes stop_codon:yes gene_type:complete